MGLKTKIEWCDASWNPVTGCKHGCNYCYARRIAERFSGYDSVTMKQEASPLLDKALEKPEIVETWDNLYFEKWSRKDEDGKPTADAKLIKAPYPFGFTPTFHRDRLQQLQKWVKPKVIFVCSMADLFGDWVPDSWIDEVFEACRKSPQHTYLFLTKNPERLCRLADDDRLPNWRNVWWGSSLDNKKARRYPGRFRDHTFLSIEPLREYMDVGLGSFGSAEWIIIGAETGNSKNKITPDKAWVDNICEAANITQAAVFMKDSLIPVVGEENMRREFPWDMPWWKG